MSLFNNFFPNCNENLLFSKIITRLFFPSVVVANLSTKTYFLSVPFLLIFCERKQSYFKMCLENVNEVYLLFSLIIMAVTFVYVEYHKITNTHRQLFGLHPL